MVKNINDLVILFDGCHKIYYCDSDDIATIMSFVDFGYEDIRGDFIKNIKKIYKISKKCGLGFIEPAVLDKKMPQLKQDSNDINKFISELKSYTND